MNSTSYPREDIQVLLLEGVSQSAVDAFRAAGYTRIEQHAKALPTEELHRRLAEAHILGIRSRTPLDADALRAARRLLALGCFCIGTNQVDLDAAQAAGIPVFNAPYSNTRSVAELVIAEAILLMRRIPEKNMACHRGGWAKSATGSYEVRDKVMGIVGYGHIGTQVGLLGEALGMRVLYHDIEPKLALGNARPADSLDDLLQRADLVTLHVPETPDTREMIDAAALGLMRPGGLLINASRGTVVDLDALAASLREGRLAGAAIDVFPVEPESNQDEFVSPLRGLDNVILTPHVGGSTLEAQDNIGREVAAKLVRYSDNGSTLSAVNFPEVALPGHAGSRRLLHVHRNVPGMLSKINELFSQSGLNIEGQYLQTRGEVGYVVIDVSGAATDAAQLKDRLAAIPGTLKARVLY